MMAVFSDLITDAASVLQYNRLRRDVGASSDVLTDAIAEDYFVEAQEKYPNDQAKMIAYARVIALRGIRASAALLGKYAQNQSEEDLTKVFTNLGDMLKDAIKEVEKVADPIESNVEPFFFGVATGSRGR
jgi:hypothetical protein